MRMKFSNWWDIEKTLLQRKLYWRAIVSLYYYLIFFIKD